MPPRHLGQPRMPERQTLAQRRIGHQRHLPRPHPGQQAKLGPAFAKVQQHLVGGAIRPGLSLRQIRKAAKGTRNSRASIK